ncbi:MAG TPA: hypothetical protein ENJ89_03320 [Caldithrix abyssi]|uniref:Putative zinc-finger domain-containing protein n=1 Tax=Caldithrix abyssi TaxID=187145 RepID=A0A7V5PN83_CALAY|nr:hypothetical protein [Caldithrix abyssi]
MAKQRITCEQAQILMMGLLDGELNEQDTQRVKQHLEECEACARQYKSFLKLKKETQDMKFKPLPEMYWDEYWNHVYNKIERGISWILVSIGAVIILAFSLYQAMSDFFSDPAEPLSLKIGTGIFVLGMIVLFVSVLREKLMVKKVDQYRRIKR